MLYVHGGWPIVILQIHYYWLHFVCLGSTVVVHSKVDAKRYGGGAEVSEGTSSFTNCHCNTYLKETIVCDWVGRLTRGNRQYIVAITYRTH